MNFNIIPTKGVNNLKHGYSVYEVLEELGEPDNTDVWQLSHEDDINIHFFYRFDENQCLCLSFSQDTNFLLQQITVSNLDFTILDLNFYGKDLEYAKKQLSSLNLNYRIDEDKKIVDPLNRRENSKDLFVEEWDLFLNFNEDICFEMHSLGSDIPLI